MDGAANGHAANGSARDAALSAAPAAAGGGGGPVRLSSWNHAFSTQPAQVVLARDTAHVQVRCAPLPPPLRPCAPRPHPCPPARPQEVVRDARAYPSPVTVVGSMHSVNECVVNDGGTLLVRRAAAAAG
jgi:hypothetical protein